jgi:hypothetical protein
MISQKARVLVFTTEMNKGLQRKDQCCRRKRVRKLVPSVSRTRATGRRGRVKVSASAPKTSIKAAQIRSVHLDG